MKLEEEENGFDPNQEPEKRAEKKTPEEDFKLILSDSTCDEISDIVEKDTSDSEETIQNIRKFVTSTLK